MIKHNVIINGIKAGYIFMLAANSPFNKSTIERCIPQPVHSKPVSDLTEQGCM